MPAVRLVATLCASLLLAACHRGGAGHAPELSSRASLLAARPYKVQLPQRRGPSPLLLVLHGYGSSSETMERYFRLPALAPFIIVTADGSRDSHGNRFWNATDACCNFSGAPVDDVAYLAAVLDDAQAQHEVDPKRVYVVGHSNGGFMANRLACELAPRIAAIVDVAGAQWKDAARCAPSSSSPVAVLHVHGDADPVIRPSGGNVFDQADVAPYPSVAATMATWAARNGCAAPPIAAASPLDFDADVAGAEGHIERWPGCARGDVELWTLAGSGHAPRLTRTFLDEMTKFLLAHPKP